MGHIFEAFSEYISQMIIHIPSDITNIILGFLPNGVRAWNINNDFLLYIFEVIKVLHTTLSRCFCIVDHFEPRALSSLLRHLVLIRFNPFHNSVNQNRSVLEILIKRPRLYSVIAFWENKGEQIVVLWKQLKSIDFWTVFFSFYGNTVLQLYQLKSAGASLEMFGERDLAFIK